MEIGLVDLEFFELQQQGPYVVEVLILKRANVVSLLKNEQVEIQQNLFFPADPNAFSSFFWLLWLP